MASLRQIRQALADAVSADDLQALPYPVSSPTPPTAHIVPDTIEYHTTFGDGEDAGEGWSFRVQVFLALVDDIGSQQRADEFIESGRIKLALEADRTLGGLVADLIVDTASFRLWEPGGSPMVGVEYACRILT